jgi:hypothetical protein
MGGVDSAQIEDLNQSTRKRSLRFSGSRSSNEGGNNSDWFMWSERKLYPMNTLLETVGHQRNAFVDARNLFPTNS